MKTFRVATSAIIPVPAKKLYAIIADYHNGHPHIIPKPYFTWLKVEQGGIGAGTIIRFQMRVLGKTQDFRAVVTEPEPGRVLVETNDGGVSVSTFTVASLAENHSRVTIATDFNARSGLLGSLEQAITNWILPRIYRQELHLLEAFAAGKVA
jgi:hypothetical protein